MKTVTVKLPSYRLPATTYGITVCVFITGFGKYVILSDGVLRNCIFVRGEAGQASSTSAEDYSIIRNDAKDCLNKTASFNIHIFVRLSHLFVNALLAPLMKHLSL